MEMSSSTAGQWMPIPGPINSHCRRSAAVASANRGYQCSGTETTRPSANSTTNASSVIRTFFAAASVGAVEVFMPRFQESAFVVVSNCRNAIQLVRVEAIIVRFSNRVQPELGQFVVPLHVNMRWIAGKEEETIWTAPQNCGAHGRRLWQFREVFSVCRIPANVRLERRAAATD